MSFQRDLLRIDLRYAKLCIELDCNTVFDSAMFRHCPTCGSVEFYPLESWLNRERADRAPVLIGNVNVDRAVRVAAMPRPLWLERLRAKRAESDARLAAGPATIQARIRSRRAS
jgi:hypothetical protein